MSKTVKMLLALALAVAVATPAFADVKLNGYYRLQGTMQNLSTSTLASGKDANTDSFIDQRIRLKMTNTLNDNISVVYYAEVDAPFGQQSKGAIGNGGKVSADGVNVETKNFYVDFKVPDSSVMVRTGIQGWGVGNAFESLVADDDMAAINVTGNAGPVKLDLVYSKWDEGSKDSGFVINQTTGAIVAGKAADATEWDDTDFYGAIVTAKPSEQLGLTGMVLYLDDNTNDIDDFYYGVNADVRVADFGIEGFVLVRNFTMDNGPGLSDTDGTAWVADIKGKAVVPMGDVKVHFAYFSEDDDATDFNTFSTAKGVFEYHNDNLMIFLTDVYYNNGSQGILALQDAAYQGYGLMMLTVSGSVKLPNAMYGKYGVGYFTAVEDTADNDPTSKVQGEDLGFEIDAMVGKKFAEKYDLSLRGAYGILGDFYAAAPGSGSSDPDDIFKVVAQLNVGF